MRSPEGSLSHIFRGALKIAQAVIRCELFGEPRKIGEERGVSLWTFTTKILKLWEMSGPSFKRIKESRLQDEVPKDTEEHTRKKCVGGLVVIQYVKPFDEEAPTEDAA